MTLQEAVARGVVARTPEMDTLLELGRLRLELEGEQKANALLNAGMGSLAESRDELKHKCRQLEARVAELEAALEPFAEYDYADVELSRLPQSERDALPVGHGHNSPTYGDCRRAAAVFKGGQL